MSYESKSRRYFYASAQGIDKAQRLLSHIKDGADKAISAALNRSLEHARALSVRAVRERYVVKAENVRKSLKVAHARPDFKRASISSTGRRLDLMAFKVTPNRPAPGRKSPIKAGLLKGSVKTMGRAFVARTPQNSLGVFSRAGNERLPVHRKYGISVPQMLGHDNVTSEIMQAAEAQFPVRLDHEIDRILRGIGGRKGAKK